MAGGLQARIGAQVIAVVGVFVAAGNLEHALSDQVGVGMVDIALMATIRQGRHDAVDDPDPGFGLPPQQSARIAGGRATVEIGFDLATRNACKTQRSPRTFHGGVFSLVAVGFLTP